MENLIQPCSHSAAAFIALSNRLPIMVVIEKSSILIPGYSYAINFASDIFVTLPCPLFQL